MTRFIYIIFIIALILLLYRLWFSDSGLQEVFRLEDAIAKQTAENTMLTERNNALAAEVIDLKEGLESVEERARSELGMVGHNESFFLVVPEMDESNKTRQAENQRADRDSESD